MAPAAAPCFVWLRGGRVLLTEILLHWIASTGYCLPNFKKRISLKSSNWEIWARWGFPTVSSPPSWFGLFDLHRCVTRSLIPILPSQSRVVAQRGARLRWPTAQHVCWSLHGFSWDRRVDLQGAIWGQRNVKWETCVFPPWGAFESSQVHSLRVWAHVSLRMQATETARAAGSAFDVNHNV